MSGNFSLISAGSISRARVPNALPDETLDLGHATVVADARDLQSADAVVMTEPVVEIDRIERCPAGEEVVAGHVAEVGCMGGRADVGRDAGLVDAHDVVPATLDEMMRHRRTDDAAETDDDDPGLLRKCCHAHCSERALRADYR
jgi:hypothetical protein